jgi:hypothetical protein
VTIRRQRMTGAAMLSIMTLMQAGLPQLTQLPQFAHYICVFSTG